MNKTYTFFYFRKIRKKSFTVYDSYAVSYLFKNLSIKLGDTLNSKKTWFKHHSIITITCKLTDGST